jgi:mRNA interferase RelE/StbE
VPIKGSAISQQADTLDVQTRRVDTESMATVILTPEAAEQLENLPKIIHARVNRLLERLQRWPAVSGAKALSGNLAGSYRLRTGDYRLLFRVKGEAVFVDKIGHRSKFYEG